MARSRRIVRVPRKALPTFELLPNREVVDRELASLKQEEEPAIYDMLNIESAIGKDEQGNPITIKRYLGGGAYGDVYLGAWLNQPIALKRVQITKKNSISARSELRVIERLAEHTEPSIVKFWFSHAETDVFYVGMEYMNQGNLSDLIKSYPVRDWDCCELIVYNCLLGVNYLHARDILHGDLKGANVLFSLEESLGGAILKVKLADFGFSISVQEADRKHISGSPLWMAPELLLPRQSKNTIASDVYSLGILIWEIVHWVADAVPFSHVQPALTEILQLTKHLENISLQDDKQPIPTDCPQNLKEMMIKAWKYNPQERPLVKELLKLSMFSYPIRPSNEDRQTDSMELSSTSYSC